MYTHPTQISENTTINFEDSDLEKGTTLLLQTKTVVSVDDWNCQEIYISKQFNTTKERELYCHAHFYGEYVYPVNQVMTPYPRGSIFVKKDIVRVATEQDRKQYVHQTLKTYVECECHGKQFHVPGTAPSYSCYNCLQFEECIGTFVYCVECECYKKLSIVAAKEDIFFDPTNKYQYRGICEECIDKKETARHQHKLNMMSIDVELLEYFNWTPIE